MSENKIDQTRLSIAALASCFAKALEQQNPGFLANFEKQLNEHYYDIRDNSEVSHIGALETLKWTGQFLKLP